METLICDGECYQKPFVVSVPVLCFQIFTPKLLLWPKMGLAICKVSSKKGLSERCRKESISCACQMSRQVSLW